jgi:hypothetical protein
MIPLIDAVGISFCAATTLTATIHSRHLVAIIV